MNYSIDLSSYYLDSGVSELLEELDSDLVGLNPVKTRIKEICALLLVDQARKKVDLTNSKMGLHMSFTGSPGTGKTTVARRISQILHKLGYLSKGHLVAVTRDDLVGQFVGHTAPKTKDMIARAQGGVLFIDEAYYLYKEDNSRDYGSEAIEILLQDMETKREDFVVIFAGYREKMNVFYSSNPGLYSRIGHHIDFPDYTNDQLMAIASLLLEKQNYRFSKKAFELFNEYIKRRRKLSFFANARSIRNAIDRAKLRHAYRLFSRRDIPITKDELMTIEEKDISASRIFEDKSKNDDLKEKEEDKF